jgi:hypothetical protein
MKKNTRPNISELMDAGTPIDEALARGIREALRRHKLLGESVVGWRDGKPALIPPEEIPDFNEDIERPPTRRSP